jgi:hypothetical protein
MLNAPSHHHPVYTTGSLWSWHTVQIGSAFLASVFSLMSCSMTSPFLRCFVLVHLAGWFLMPVSQSQIFPFSLYLLCILKQLVYNNSKYPSLQSFVHVCYFSILLAFCRAELHQLIESLVHSLSKTVFCWPGVDKGKMHRSNLSLTPSHKFIWI